MPYFQRVQIMGVTGDEPEYKVLDSGPLARFSVCVDEYYRDKDGEKQKIKTWFRCSCFGKLAEQAQQALGKGTWIFVEGHMRTRQVRDEKGILRDFWSITVDQFRRLEGKRVRDPQPEDMSERERPVIGEH